MNDDLLERATRALRESSAEPQPKSGLTRARILESAEKQAVRRRGGWLRWFVGIGVALGASTALARVAQQYWPEIQRAIAPAADVREAAPARAKKKAVPKPPAVVPAEPPPQLAAAEPETAPAPPPTAAPVEAPPAATPPAPKRARPPKPRPAPAPAPAPEALAASAPAPAPAPAESAELALFRRAQRLHDARDPAALAAWDDYLRVAARGVLVPEARYNRALCLVRAGKNDAARTALEPFARGDYGSFRRREARALLDALTGKAR